MIARSVVNHVFTHGAHVFHARPRVSVAKVSCHGTNTGCEEHMATAQAARTHHSCRLEGKSHISQSFAIKSNARPQNPDKPLARPFRFDAGQHTKRFHSTLIYEVFDLLVHTPFSSWTGRFAVPGERVTDVCSQVQAHRRSRFKAAVFTSKRKQKVLWLFKAAVVRTRVGDQVFTCWGCAGPCSNST
jgi:hypothetical protein